MEGHESTFPRHTLSNREAVKEKVPLQRKWESEPSAGTKRDTFSERPVRHRESLPCGASLGLAPQQKYATTGNFGKLLSAHSVVGDMEGSHIQDSQGHFAQGFPRGSTYQLGQPYPQHPQSEHILSGAKPQPGLEPNAWPFAGQLPCDDLYPVGHPVRTHPHGAGAGRFPHQKSPSLPSCFGRYSQSVPESLEEGYSKKEQKPKKPGKYICHFCGRACAKPSVLKKHIRSHTGERPYPCVPCGFSFKTKSNLYKHRKSHTHAIKAGLVPFSELAAARGGDTDQVSPVGEAEVHSDGEQSTDTDEEGVEGSTMLMDKDCSIPQISFEADKHKGGFEPAYADSAEELPMGNIKVPILIVPKCGGEPSTGMDCPPFQDIKECHSHHMLTSQLGRRSHSLEESSSIKQSLARKPHVKKGQDVESAITQSLNLLSPHSKGSTDSGYFSRSESAEQQTSPPNTNVKTYEELMFGRTYYPPNTRSKQSIAVAIANPASMAKLKQPGTVLDSKIAKDHVCFKGGGGTSGDIKQYPTGPSQSSTVLLEPPVESGHLIRSNSMPTSCPPNLSVPPSIRGSHSFDEMMSSDDVFYPQGLRKSLIRQAAFEQAAEGHVGEAEIYGHFHKNLTSSLVMKIGERGQGAPESMAVSSTGTKMSMSEQARRKRHIDNSEGDEEDTPRLYDSICSGSVEMTGEYEFKQSSLEGSRGTPTGKGSFSAHSQSDSFDTCTSMCSEDISLFPDSEIRKAAGNVISVIQHTNSLSRPNSFEKSESFEQSGHQSLDKGLTSQCSEHSDTDIYEDALSPDSALMRTESTEQPPQSDSDLASLSSTSAAPSPGQPYNNPHKLVRQPNIQVPEIRVTEEPDKPEKDAEVPSTKEMDTHHHQQQQQSEEFQLPQRSDTLSQMPSEKLPPKKKRLRLTDMEHSSGESSFESTCTSLSRSPSQESNLSHSSSFSMSFDRDEGLKSLSPTKQDESSNSGVGPKQSEFLTVPGSAHSSHHHQREMRRSSSEQAPCTLPLELPEMRSKSFDYGSLSPTRQTEVHSSVSATKERRRGHLVRQVSLSVYSEAITHEQGIEVLVKQEAPEHGMWSGLTGSSHMSSDVPSRTRRSGSITGLHHQQHLQQSMSEDSLQDEPLYSRPQQCRLQAQGSSSESENPAHETSNRDIIQPYLGGSTFSSCQQAAGLFWSQECGQTTRQQPTQAHVEKLQMRSPGSLVGHSPHKKQPLCANTQIHDQQLHNGKSDKAGTQSISRTSPQTLVLAGVSSTPMILQQVQPVFATQNLASQPPLPSMLVPVRIQTHVPSFGSAMYTSVSQLIENHCSGGGGVGLAVSGSNISPISGATKPSGGKGESGFNLSLFLGHTDGSALRYPMVNDSDSLQEQQMKTGIPLSLTSGTISTTDACGSSVGGGKRMLSPTSSLELFIETKQQKRVKEERMYGQILKEMSAVELSGTEKSSQHEKGCGNGGQDQSMDDNVATRIAIPVRSSAPQPPDVPRVESFTPPLQIVTDHCPSGGMDSPDELEVDDSDPGPCCSPQSMMSSDKSEDVEDTKRRALGETPARYDVPQYFQFPSLHTVSRVSWCFLKYTKPNSSQTGLHSSVYSSWSINSYNPNPLNLSTKNALALLRSKQSRNTDLVYTTAVLSPPSSGKLVSSVAWKLKFDQFKPELVPLAFGRKMKGVLSWERSKEEQEQQKEVPVKQPMTEPTRIKIFDGGYKSNEDYVYVRGRGRGKYICEECGIRCKKPSMLKKHIRTHTDVRPYVCKFCNFAFKTKGNLTKHMKSKAHMKKCLELGVSMSSVEDTEVDEGDMADEGQKLSEKISRGAITEHQFSDADDSEGCEEDADEVDDEDDEEDDYDGDSTPKTRSRSTSPQPFGLSALSVTAVASSHPSTYSTPDLKPPLFGFFTTVPSIHITAQAASTEEEHPRDFQRGLKKTQGGALLVPPPASIDEDFPDLSSHLSSPGSALFGCPSPCSPSSSPSSRRYLSPRRDLSPRARHLSPRRDISPKRDLLSATAHRRDASPRRGHLTLLSPLSRPTSPGGRDYRRDLSPRGRHKGVIRPLSPRRGLHPHLHHLSQQSSARSFRPNHQMGTLVKGRGRSTTDMETELSSESPGEHGRPGNQESPPHQLLFSHLPLHSQLQVRSPFTMIPIGGIQMVHSVLPSVTAPLSQQGELYTTSHLSLQKSTSEESASSESAPPPHFSSFMERVVRPRGGGEWGRESPPPQLSSQVKGEGEVRQEQEEGVQTCTKAIASLCINSEKSTERGAHGEGGEGKDRGEPPPSGPPPESSLHHLGSPSVQPLPPPYSSTPPPGIQHFSTPHSASSSSTSLQPPPTPDCRSDSLPTQRTAGSKPVHKES